MKTFLDLSTDATESETWVRDALRLLEHDFREMVLLALSDFAGLNIVAPEMFEAVGSLMRPAWGSWFGLINVLLRVRTRVLCSNDRVEIEKIGSARILDEVLNRYKDDAPVEVAGIVRAFNKSRGADPLPPTGEGVWKVPLEIRNKLEHGRLSQSTSSSAEWDRIVSLIRNACQAQAEKRIFPAFSMPEKGASPWILRRGADLWSLNQLTDRFLAVYVNRSAEIIQDRQLGGDLVFAIQRLLGKENLREERLKKLLAKLAPEEIRGVLLGDFLVGPPVGWGGFATVHKGRQLSTGRTVAIKILNDGSTEVQRRRFLQESIQLSHCNHPNIVQFIASGEEPWTPSVKYDLSNQQWYKEFSTWKSPMKLFIVMEWIGGDTLEEKVRQGLSAGRGLEPELLLRWFTQATSALQEMHEARILHRDLKPANLMLTEDDNLKVMDFGTTGAMVDIRARELLTQNGEKVGTDAYMAPELFRAGSSAAGVLTPSLDIYSLCASFYEIYTGFRIFSSDELSPAQRLERKFSRPLVFPQSSFKLLSWEIRTILQGGLEPDPADRYVSMRGLMSDLKAVAENEPISVYKRPSLCRLGQLFYRRHRSLVKTVSVAVVALLAVTTFWLFDRYLNHTQLYITQSDTALAGEPETFIPRLDDLKTVRTRIIPHLQSVSAHPDSSSGSRRATLALAYLSSSNPAIRPPVRTADLVRAEEQSPSAAEAMVARSVLQVGTINCSAALWKDVSHSASAAERLNALIALSAIDPASPQWTPQTEFIVDHTLGSDPIEFASLSKAFDGVSAQLVPPLKRAFSDSTLESGARERAADMLARYVGRDSSQILDLLARAEGPQFRALRDAAVTEKASLLPDLRIRARQRFLESDTVSAPDTRASGESIDSERTRKAKQNGYDLQAYSRANAAVALLELGNRDDQALSWSVLEFAADPSARSYLLHDFKSHGLEMSMIANKYLNDDEQSKSEGIRSALLLGLGEYPLDELPIDSRAHVISQVISDYASNPNAGIHSAAEWLLRRWELNRDIVSAKRSLMGLGRGTTSWYINKQGVTFAVFPAGIKFTMGAPADEPDQRPSKCREDRHSVRIPRSFAMAATPVTRVEFEQFLKTEGMTQYLLDDSQSEKCPQADCPIIFVPWLLAVVYCNYLSECEGLQQVYPTEISNVVKNGKLSDDVNLQLGDVRMPDHFLLRTGYRLPTEAEWEFACRAGSTTARPYGRTERLLSQYSYYPKVTGDRRCFPVGTLKPNSYGMFDMPGNAMQWCQGSIVYSPLPPAGPDGYQSDDETDLNIVVKAEGRAVSNVGVKANTKNRVLRGGAWLSRPIFHRSASRNEEENWHPYDGYGFRVARTLPSNEDHAQ